MMKNLFYTSFWHDRQSLSLNLIQRWLLIKLKISDKDSATDFWPTFGVNKYQQRIIKYGLLTDMFFGVTFILNKYTYTQRIACVSASVCVYLCVYGCACVGAHFSGLYLLCDMFLYWRCKFKAWQLHLNWLFSVFQSLMLFFILFRCCFDFLCILLHFEFPSYLFYSLLPFLFLSFSSPPFPIHPSWLFMHLSCSSFAPFCHFCCLLTHTSTRSVLYIKDFFS